MKKRKKQMIPDAWKHMTSEERLLKAILGEYPPETETPPAPKPRSQTIPRGHEEWFCVSHLNKGKSWPDWYAVCGTKEQAIYLSERKLRELNPEARIESFQAKTKPDDVQYVAVLEPADIVPMHLRDYKEIPRKKGALREHCKVFLKPISRRLAMDYLRKADTGKKIGSCIVYLEF